MSLHPLLSTAILSYSRLFSAFYRGSSGLDLDSAGSKNLLNTGIGSSWA
jgi:hypothetical protein